MDVLAARQGTACGAAVRRCGLCPRLRLNRPVDTMDVLAARQATACGAVVRRCGLCPRLRLNRPVDTMDVLPDRLCDEFDVEEALDDRALLVILRLGVHRPDVVTAAVEEVERREDR